ncbi:hypothetical protein [Rhizobium sp. RAF56]|uniref:hypothetical protein n=1 Tax=Rhizobium sp. RAF56 TaxID=3233062 RepID=UPI003F9CDCCA
MRSKGFNAKDLEFHLAEFEDHDPIVEEPVDVAEEDDVEADQKEMAWLHKELADLREQLAILHSDTDGSPTAKANARPWLPIAASAAAMFVLGRVVQRLRLRSAGAPSRFR